MTYEEWIGTQVVAVVLRAAEDRNVDKLDDPSGSTAGAGRSSG